MINLAELNTSGWTLVDGVSSKEDLLELGNTLGCPVPSPNGEMIKEIRKTSKTKAPPGSQSAIYGTGPFPLHTDTVFWPLPIRYVILRGYGDTRRPTTVMNFSQLLSKTDASLSVLAEKSVWIVGMKSKRFYCSLRFRHGGLVGCRYDADLMTPANIAAIQVNKVLRPLVACGQADCIEWSNDKAVILSNWNALHGRGPEPSNEGIRIIERLYVR